MDNEGWRAAYGLQTALVWEETGEEGSVRRSARPSALASGDGEALDVSPRQGRRDGRREVGNWSKDDYRRVPEALAFAFLAVSPWLDVLASPKN